MDVNAITQLIGTVGFPIVCCIYLFWKDEKQSERHKKETDKLADVVNNNTVTLTKLLERMDIK